MKKDKGQGTEKGKAWLKREMRPYRPFILFLTALTVAGTLLSLAFAYLTRYLVNSASEKDGKRLILFAVILLSTLLLRILVQTAVKYLSEKGRAKISVELKNKLFSDAPRRLRKLRKVSQRRFAQPFRFRRNGGGGGQRQYFPRRRGNDRTVRGRGRRAADAGPAVYGDFCRGCGRRRDFDGAVPPKGDELSSGNDGGEGARAARLCRRA